jgi:hypothetical protein
MIRLPRQLFDCCRLHVVGMRCRESVFELDYIRIYCRPDFALSTGRGGRLHRSVQVLTRPLRTGFVSNAFAVPQSCTLPNVLTALTIGSLDGAPIRPSVVVLIAWLVEFSRILECNLGWHNLPDPKPD